METVKGDLIEKVLQGDFDAICHGCNCRRRMSGSLAKSIAEVFPEAEEADMRTGDVEFKLGRFSYEFILRPFAAPRKGKLAFAIGNLYTQYLPGSNANLKHIETSLNHFLTFCDSRIGMKRIGVPMIGAGIGGLQADEVRKVIEKVADRFPQLEVTLVEWSKNT